MALPGDIFTLKRSIQLRNEVKEYLLQKISSRREVIKKIHAKGENLCSQKFDCYLDAYLLEAARLNAEKGEGNHLFHGI